MYTRFNRFHKHHFRCTCFNTKLEYLIPYHRPSISNTKFRQITLDNRDMAMTMTIWWPRSGVWIYQIVTGRTSVVGVPSTHLVLLIDGWGISCEVALRWMSRDLTDDKSALVQVMVWCHQGTSHCMGQCWARSRSPYRWFSARKT